jgi:hypothetical protein
MAQNSAHKEEKNIVYIISILELLLHFYYLLFKGERIFKSFVSSRRPRPDYFVESHWLRVLDNQMCIRVYHYIDELHKKVHHICIQILKRDEQTIALDVCCRIVEMSSCASPVKPTFLRHVTQRFFFFLASLSSS